METGRIEAQNAGPVRATDHLICARAHLSFDPRRLGIVEVQRPGAHTSGGRQVTGGI
jgi:hypothetical protein